jgi:hypothetical protein
MLDFIIELLCDFSSERARMGCMAFLLAIVAIVLLAAWLRIPAVLRSGRTVASCGTPHRCNAWDYF